MVPPLRLLLAGLLAATVAASACAPREDEADAVRGRIDDIELPPDVRVTIGRVAAGDTMGTLLHANNEDGTEVHALVECVQVVFDVRKMRTNQPYRAERSADGQLSLFEYEIDRDRALRLRRLPAGAAAPFAAEIVPIAKTHVLAVVRGEIDRDTPSLFAAMDAAGETIDLPLALADIFGGDIDFNSELQPGDSFQLAVEKQYRGCDDVARTGAPVARVGTVEVRAKRERAGHDPGDAEACRVFAGYGPIVAAEFNNDGRRLRAIRFAPAGGEPGYYDERGGSLRRFLLRSPLKFEPMISSRFSRARMHPILREVRAHLGIDYRAPAGAPVVAVADGVVVQAGMSGASGKMVHLRHANAFESQYLHLSAIAVRGGVRVRQGDLIGRVGATGLATGPHLDYRLKKNGAFVNPLKAHREMPSAEPISPALIETFAAARNRALAVLSAPSSGAVAAGAPSRSAAVDQSR